MSKVFFMLNPFDLIIERLSSLESKLSETKAHPALPPIEIIGRKELCNRLAITEPTVIRWERKGKIPSFNIGSSVRYNWHHVISVLEGKMNSSK